MTAPVQIRKTRNSAHGDNFYLGRPWSVRRGDLVMWCRTYEDCLRLVNGWGR
jgi:hypothetical protein